MKKFFTMMMIMAFAAVANAGVVTYDWEDRAVGDTEGVLGAFGNIGSAVVSDEQAHSGSNSIKVVESPVGGTPQVYLAWVTGLTAGDTVTASIWIYDDTPDAAASGRIWGHYATNDDVNYYAGSAGGNNTYSDGYGWSQVSYTWTIADGKEALIIEGRIYSDNSAYTIYIDDISIDAPDTATVMTPAVPEPATMSLIGAGALALLRRKRA